MDVLHLPPGEREELMRSDPQADAEPPALPTPRAVEPPLEDAASTGELGSLGVPGAVPAGGQRPDIYRMLSLITLVPSTTETLARLAKSSPLLTDQQRRSIFFALQTYKYGTWLSILRYYNIPCV